MSFYNTEELKMAFLSMCIYDIATHHKVLSYDWSNYLGRKLAKQKSSYRNCEQ